MVLSGQTSYERTDQTSYERTGQTPCERIGAQAGRGELGRHPPIRAENPLRRIVYAAGGVAAGLAMLLSLQSAIDRGA